MKPTKKSTNASSVGSRKAPSMKPADTANASVITPLASPGPVIPKAGAVSAAATPRSPAVQPSASTVTVKNTESSAMSVKPHGKYIATSESPAKPISNFVMLFRDLTLGPHQRELRFRLIHFYEARNPISKTLIGEEMLLIDEEGTMVQGFIPPGKIGDYLPHMKAGSVYRLNNFYGSKSKDFFRVADQTVTVSFSWNSVLSVLQNSPVDYPEDHFRFHSHDQFDENADLRGDLYDCVGHMKVVNGHALINRPTQNEVLPVETRQVTVHVQAHDGPVMKVNLWENAAADFCRKFKKAERTPSTLLVTTLNPKRYEGTLSLSTMSSSRVFMDHDIQPTRDYLIWLSSKLDVAMKTNGEFVTKRETVSIGELFAYIKKPDTKVAWFECVATIDDVVCSSSWYYIACDGCRTKATKGPTSFMCKKCGKTEVNGVAQYLTKISVYDESEQAVFVLLGDAGRELTGHAASEFVESFFEENEGLDAEHVVPVPEGLLGTIGERRRFCVKVSEHNLTVKTMSITVTKVLPTETPPPLEEAEDGGVKRPSDGYEAEENKRPKSG